MHLRTQIGDDALQFSQLPPCRAGLVPGDAWCDEPVSNRGEAKDSQERFHKEQRIKWHDPGHNNGTGVLRKDIVSAGS